MQRLETDDDSSNGKKYYVNCQDLIKETNTSREWLNNIHVIPPEELPENKDARMSEKILMKAMFHNKEEIVIKAGITSQIVNEWNIYNELVKYKIPGVLKYYCYFTCNEDFKKIPDNTPSICNGADGTGKQLNVLLMKICKLGNIADYKWKSNEAFQSCVKQALLTVLQAYTSVGFYHEDCHVRNFLLQQTTKKIRQYTCLLYTSDAADE